MNQTTEHQPVPSVPSAQADKKSTNEKARQLGTTALEATRDNAAVPLIQGFFAAAGALLAYAGGKKVGWL